MTKRLVSLLAFLLLLFVLSISEVDAAAEPKLCEKPSKMIWFGKCEEKSCDDRCKFWERAVRGACLVREAKPSCFCYYDCPKDKTPSPPPPPADGGPSPPPPADGGSPPPPADGGSPPPPADGGSPPPPADGGSPPPPAAGGSPPPPAAGGSPPPPADGGSPPPSKHEKQC